MDAPLQSRFRVELVPVRSSHMYRIDNSATLSPGVTTILNVINKPYLVPWAAKEAAKRIQAYLLQHAVDRPLTADEIVELVEEGRQAHVEKKEAAADVGTRAHRAVNEIIEGREPVLTDDIRPCVEAFQSWQAKSGIVMKVGDTKVASKIYGFGGSLDALGSKDGKLILIDFKTSNHWNDEFAFQVAAYCHAFTETFGAVVQEAMILKLGKTEPTFEVKRVKDILGSFGVFLSALRLYRERQIKQFENVFVGKEAA